jgi:hypothetical protein
VQYLCRRPLLLLLSDSSHLSKWVGGECVVGTCANSGLVKGGTACSPLATTMDAQVLIEM